MLIGHFSACFIKFHAKAFPFKDGKKYVVEFDFLGKDSIRYLCHICELIMLLRKPPSKRNKFIKNFIIHVYAADVYVNMRPTISSGGS